jgi:hypothetical protein
MAIFTTIEPLISFFILNLLEGVSNRYTATFLVGKKCSCLAPTSEIMLTGVICI